MSDETCPNCGEPLKRYPDYFYCFRCSKQYKKKFFGGLKEVKNTLQSDQKKAMRK